MIKKIRTILEEYLLQCQTVPTIVDVICDEYMFHSLKRKILLIWLIIAICPIHSILKDSQSREATELDKSNHIYSFLFSSTLISMYLPYFKKDGIQKYIFRHKRFFEASILAYVKENYLHPSMVYLDCGANIGNHTIFFSLIAKAQKVYAFEGLKDTYTILEKNIQLNHLEHVEAYNYVLGAHEGYAEVASYHEENIGGTSFSETSESTSKIKMIKIDDFNIKEKVDFIKMDVEGFEKNVLKGMEQLLKKDRPILMIEIFNENYAEVSALLNSYGYYLAEKISQYDDYIFKYMNHTELATDLR